MSEKYWEERGRTYLGDFNKKTVVQRVRYWIQEKVIIGALNRIKKEIKVQSILDAGCGFGRITRILCLVFPYSVIRGIDISEAQLKEATVRLPRVMFWKKSVLNEDVFFNDLTVAVELLMHIEPENIESAIINLTGAQPHRILSVDWWTEDEEDIRLADLAGFCYLHYYEALFGMYGFNLVREKKIPFVNQKLRVWRRDNE